MNTAQKDDQLLLKKIEREWDFPRIDPEQIETLEQVAKGLKKTTETVKKLALQNPHWRGKMMRICIKKGEGKASDKEYFFPAGTIEANKEKFYSDRARPTSRELDDLKAENEQLKKMALRLEAIEMRIKNGGLLPADEAEGPGF